MAGGAVHARAAVSAPGPSAGYGPPPPGVVTPPGGYSAVVTSQTITPAGGIIGPVSVDGGSVTLVIPAGAFPVNVQITLTAPDLAAVGSGGVAGDDAVAGVGIQVQENGVPYPGTFLKPLGLTMRSSSITSSSVVVVWNGSVFVAETGATITPGAATVSFDSDPDFAVLAPRVALLAPIPGATRSMTGEPFVGEGIVAGVLLLLGVGGLARAVRRSRVSARL